MAGVKLTRFKDGRYCLSFYLDGKRRRETFSKLREAQLRSNEVERLKGRGIRVKVKEEIAADESSQYAIKQLTANGISTPLTAVVDEYVAAYQALEGQGSSFSGRQHFIGRLNHTQWFIGEFDRSKFASGPRKHADGERSLTGQFGKDS
jgi:hypothetical protein